YLVTTYEELLASEPFINEGLAFARAMTVAQSALTTITVLCGLLLVPFVDPPTPAWVGGNRLAGDWRPTILAGVLLIAYGVIVAWDPLRAFFELTALRAIDYALLAGVALAWGYLLRFTWRHRLLDRFLSL